MAVFSRENAHPQHSAVVEEPPAIADTSGTRQDEIKAPQIQRRTDSKNPPRWRSPVMRPKILRRQRSCGSGYESKAASFSNLMGPDPPIHHTSSCPVTDRRETLSVSVRHPHASCNHHADPRVRLRLILVRSWSTTAAPLASRHVWERLPGEQMPRRACFL